MSETKFTPGPWGNLLEDESVPGVPCIRIFAPFGKGETEICQVSSFLNDESGEFEFREEEMANAHLIAAAPEMLRALEDVLDALTDGGRRVFSEDQNDYHVGAIKRVLKKALNERQPDEKI